MSSTSTGKIRPFQPKLRPWTAFRALTAFLKNKEDTSLVFRFTSALDGPTVERNFQRFVRTDLGERVLRHRIDLLDALSDKAWLQSLPEGSLGRAYLDFTSSEGISAASFQDEMDAAGERYNRAGEDRQRYIYRVRHTHDLLHVLTGYGRDLVGEIGVVSFTGAQNGSLAFKILTAVFAAKAAREYPGVNPWRVRAEGRRLGRAAASLFEQDWEALLARPLSELRRELRIGVPRYYLSVKTAASVLDTRYRAELPAAAH